MNPYEAPHAGDEPTPEQRSRSRTVAWGLILAAFLIVGGSATLFMVRLERASAIEEALMRAEQAATAEAMQALEETTKPESLPNPLAP